MEFKGTKGKWYIGPDLFGLGRNLIMTNKGGTFICDVYKREGRGFEEDYKYNAQLIAHAPEMLNIINEFVVMFEGVLNEGTDSYILHKKAKELIKSATTHKKL